MMMAPRPKQAPSRAEGATPKSRSGSYVHEEQRSTEVITFRAPKGFKAALAAAAERRGMTINAMLASHFVAEIAIETSIATNDTADIGAFSERTYQDLEERADDISNRDGRIVFTGQEDEDDDSTYWAVTMSERNDDPEEP